jgi:hypothetical protein
MIAIERASSPYEPAPVPAVMDFFSGYARLAQTHAPDLFLKRNPNSGAARPKASRTIYFETKRSGFRSYPFLLKQGRFANLSMSHQCWDSLAPSASVKVMIGGWAQHLPVVSPLLVEVLRPSGIHVRNASRSLALVLDTPRLDNMRPAEEQELAILDALTKLQRLRTVWNDLEDTLRDCAARVR